MKLYLKKDKWLLAGAIILGGINAALSAFISLLLQQIIDVALAKDLEGFWSLLLYMAIYLAVLGIMGFLEAYCGKRLLRNVCLHMRNRIFQGVMRKSPPDFFSRNTADYLSALINDVKLIEENYLVPLLLCSQMAVLFLTTLGILFYLSPLVTFILLAFLILMFLIPGLLGKSLQRRQDEYSERLAKFTGSVKDFFNGYEVIRGYSMHSYIWRRYTDANRETADKKFSADKLLAVNECFSDILSALSITVVVFVSAYLVLVDRITMGTLLALIQLSGTFVTPVVMLMQNLPKITGIRPVLEQLGQLSEEPSAPPAPHDSEADRNPLSSPAVFQKELLCENVTFAYQENQSILKGLDLRLEKGKKYMLLGESGSGKSTLIRLLTGYSQEYQGRISLDGTDLKSLPQDTLNSLVSVIHQNIFLFDTDIQENICLGLEFTQQELARAVHDSGVEQFLPHQEAGLKTPTGENGQLLSGGQRQRIAVARALIRKTPVLILDEGTSAVDEQTALEIEKSLLDQRELTLLTITHHFHEEIASRYDHILRLQDGCI